MAEYQFGHDGLTVFPVSIEFITVCNDHDYDYEHCDIEHEHEEMPYDERNLSAQGQTSGCSRGTKSTVHVRGVSPWFSDSAFQFTVPRAVDRK
jgi:hypothetical protein